MPIAVDVGGTKIACALVHGSELEGRREVPTPQPATPDAVVKVILELVRNPDYASEGVVGVAMTGRVIDGRVTAANPETLPSWDDFPLRETLARNFMREVVVVNDAQAAAWGEYQFGAGERTSNGFAFVTISTGVGAGIVVDGRLLSGSRGWGGHIGFTRVGDQYLEDLVSGKALGRLVRGADGRFLSAAEFIDLSSRDAEARSLLRGAVSTLRSALGNLAVQADVSLVAVGGSVGLNPRFFKELGKEACHSLVDVKLVSAVLGKDAGMIGVGAAVVSELRSS